MKRSYLLLLGLATTVSAIIACGDGVEAPIFPFPSYDDPTPSPTSDSQKNAPPQFDPPVAPVSSGGSAFSSPTTQTSTTTGGTDGGSSTQQTPANGASSNSFDAG